MFKGLRVEKKHRVISVLFTTRPLTSIGFYGSMLCITPLPQLPNLQDALGINFVLQFFPFVHFLLDIYRFTAL